MSIAALTFALASGMAAPELNDETFTSIRDYVMPRESEITFDDLPWRTSLWEAALEAQRREKPILLFAMNGHPMACT
jgi:hypothetical protein